MIYTSIVVTACLDIRHGICPEFSKIYMEGGESPVVIYPERDADSNPGSPSQKATPTLILARSYQSSGPMGTKKICKIAKGSRKGVDILKVEH